ncbi:MAG: hypothetical protein ABI416_18505 [Ginsengibacter sp.]
MKKGNQTHIYTCLLVICPLLFPSSAVCQNNQVTISSLFSQYHQNTIREKIFVHTDKSFYVAGEIAWFKLYAVDASDHKPLELSKVAYVEITDSANKHVLQAKIDLINAEGWGSFYIPLNLNSGNYKLRAYTNWMKNFGADYFFEKIITIINIQKRIHVAATKPANKPDIQFFPEGGNLVNSILSKIAFKGTDQHGKGIKFKGVVLDNSDTILTFNPQHAGMGFFSLIPVNNHLYKAVIQTETGETITKALPQVYNGGYVMSLTELGGKIKVTVQTDITAANQVYLFIHTREVTKASETGHFQQGQAVFLIDKEILGDGISHITVFNDQRQPVCERLYFKKPSKQLDIKLNTDLQSYAGRTKVSVNIQTGDNALKNDSTSLSMTVYRVDSLQSPETPFISSYLLLTSDLRGNIEDPNYYFLKDDPETNSALDNLMLTNGWRRFKWEEIFKTTKPFFEFIPEYNGHVITGKIIDTKSGNPGTGLETTLAFPGFITGFNTATSDKQGRIRYELKKMYGSAQAIVQINSSTDNDYHLEVADPYSNEFSGNVLPEFTLNAAYINSLREQSISMQVQNIYSAKKLRIYYTARIDTASFYLHPDQVYLLDNYTRFTTMEEVLREYVMMVNVRKREGRFHFSVFDLGSLHVFKNDPLVLLDGVPVADINKFMETDPLKLYKLEVLNRKYFLGNSVFEGILSWTSYKEDMAGYDPGRHAMLVDYDGMQPEREFYSPAYNTEDQLSSHIPDFRNVLLWSPHIKIAPGASKEINFFTSDMPGKYIVQVQGISGSGAPAFASSAFTVVILSKKL